MMYRIFSWEHDSFWRASWQGYTREVREAGVYSRKQAAEIVEQTEGDEVAIVVPGKRESGDTDPDVIVFTVTTVAASTDVLVGEDL